MKKALFLVVAITIVAGLIVLAFKEYMHIQPDPPLDMAGDIQHADERATNEREPPAYTGQDQSDNSHIAVAIAEWQRASGYYMDLSDLPGDYVGEIEIVHPYQAYDDEVLRELADGNDMIAAVMLADRLLRSTEQSVRDEGIRLHERAAALGSTFSALILGSEHFTRQSTEGKSNTVEALAWYQVAMGRGDPGGASSFNFAVGGQPLDAETAEKVCERAAIIRGSLEDAREQMSLPEFDDSPPPIPAGANPDQLFTSSLNCNNG